MHDDDEVVYEEVEEDTYLVESMQQEEILRKERDMLLMMLTPYEVAKYCDRPKLVRTLSGERDFVEVESMYAESDYGDGDGVTTIASSMYEEVTVTTAEFVALEQQQSSPSKTTKQTTSLLEGFLSSPVRQRPARNNTPLPNQTAATLKEWISPSKTTSPPLLSASNKNETIALPSPRKKTTSWSERNHHSQQQHRGNEIWQLPSPHKNHRSTVVQSSQFQNTETKAVSSRNEIWHLPSPHKHKPQNCLKQKSEMDETEKPQTMHPIELLDDNDDDDSTEEEENNETQSPMTLEEKNLSARQGLKTLPPTPILDDDGTQPSDHEDWMNPLSDELSRLRAELAQMQAEAENHDSNSINHCEDEDIYQEDIHNGNAFHTEESDENNGIEDELERLRADLANMQEDGSNNYDTNDVEIHEPAEESLNSNPPSLATKKFLAFVESGHPILPTEEPISQMNSNVIKTQSSDVPCYQAIQKPQNTPTDDSTSDDALGNLQPKTEHKKGGTKEEQNDVDERQRLQTEIVKLQSQTETLVSDAKSPKIGKESKSISVGTSPQANAFTGLNEDDSEIRRLQEEIAKLESETSIFGLADPGNKLDDNDDELHRLQVEIANMEAKLKGSGTKILKRSPKKKVVKKVVRRKKDNNELELEAKRLEEEIARMQREIEEASKSQSVRNTIAVESETKVSVPKLSNKVEPGTLQPKNVGADDSNNFGDALLVNAKAPIVDTTQTVIKKSPQVESKNGSAELAKYHQMKKIGLPEGAIRQAMERDGVDLAHMYDIFGPAPRDNVMPTSPMDAALTMYANSDDPSLAKYYQMLKIGLPEGAVMNAMERAGVDPDSIFAERATVPPEETKNPVIDIEKNRSDPRYSKYFTMLDIGLPDGAVRNAMERDQVDPSAVFGIDCKPKQTLLQVAAAEAMTESKIVATPPSMTNLLGAIEKAANKREKRLEENGGELFMQDIAPEVEIRNTTMQLSTSMAEMIAQRAIARDKRLEAGGEKRMRKVVIKEKEEYKQQFSSIVEDAAAMGRLTRLNEHTVEAVAQEKTPEQEWKSNGLLAIQWRSNHMAVIHDAARAGQEFKLPEHVVSNYKEEEHEGWDPDHTDPRQRKLSPRMRQLLELDKTAGEGQKKVEKLLLGLKEVRPKEDSLLIRPMQAYRSIEEVKLPRDAPPRIDPKKQAERMSKILQSGRPMMDISVGVAEKAWERRARLDRPGSLPKVKEKCDCPYCGNASPYQTFAYRELERKRKDEQAEWERKRLERARIREEKRRKLQEATARDRAIAAEEELEKRADSTDEVNVLLPLASSPSISSVHANVEPAATSITTTRFLPEESAPSRVITCSNDVQSKIQQWNYHTMSHPVHGSDPKKGSKYAQPNPAESGCRCIIM